MNAKDNPLFSIVIPAFNCEDFIGEAIESVLAQDIGFAGNIQLVLVNDGSIDGTEEICRRYANRHPNDILLINQDNAGASAARLRGLSQCKGAFVNFLDADDKWSEDACSCVQRFLCDNPDISVFTTQHHFFGVKNGRHPLSYKYDFDSVVDLNHTIDYPQLSLSNAFVRRELLLPEYFDNRLKVSEDFLVINRILMREKRYGVLSQPIYWYRKRTEANSAIDTSTKNASWYLDTPRYCYKTLFEESKAKQGAVAPFLQYSVMYDMQWRIKNKNPAPLSDSQHSEYRALIIDLLRDIDDEIILTQRNLNEPQRLYVLALKYKMTFPDLQGSLFVVKDAMFFKRPNGQEPLRISNIGGQARVHIDFISDDKQSIAIEGRFPSVFPRNRLHLYVNVGSEMLRANIFPRMDKKYDSFFEDAFFEENGFFIDIPLSESISRTSVSFFLLVDGRKVRSDVSLGKFCPLSTRRYDYARMGNWILTLVGKRKDRIVISPYSKSYVTKREILFNCNLLLNRKSRKKIKYRRYASRADISNKKNDKQIWLISDRTTMAGDNGEALFSYLQKYPVPGVETYFVINADSPDYIRMKSIGKVVAFGSDKHVHLQMRSAKIISSAADEFVYDRFGEDQYLAKSHERFDFVFLQHGITKDDMSKWLNRYNKNIALFICAAQPEYDSIIQNKAYGYDERQVKLTGFPRHDKLQDMNRRVPTEKKVLIAPTWRSYLAGPVDRKLGCRTINPQFENTKYYHFYQDLLNDEHLFKAAQDLGYSVRFLIHPALAPEAHKFSSPFAEIITEYDYPREFSTAEILVTDYSSVAFDFALLRKPILYAQFDKVEFYEKHGWGHGYFDYERDGFGEIHHSLDDTVNGIIELMHNPRTPELYRRRADAFFYEPENGNRCAAVVNAIRNTGRNRI